MTQADQLLASLAVLRRQWRRRILVAALAWVALAAVIVSSRAARPLVAAGGLANPGCGGEGTAVVIEIQAIDLAAPTDRTRWRTVLAERADVLEDFTVIGDRIYGTYLRDTRNVILAFDRAGSLTLSFDEMTVRGRTVPIRAMATQVFQSGGIREEVGTAGVGAGVGGVIGGILGAFVWWIMPLN